VLPFYPWTWKLYWVLNSSIRLLFLLLGEGKERECFNAFKKWAWIIYDQSSQEPQSWY
jgi:hypothetical protein